jgi:hypothetical protein
MARYRTLKPQTWSDANLTSVSRDARLLFIGTWSFVDDKGRAQLSYQQLKNQIFPADLDIDAKTVESWFAELVRTGVVEIYEVREGRKTVRYFRVPKFSKHQKIDKPSHCDTPPSPTEDPDESACECRGCKINRRIMFPQERSEDSSNGRRLVGEESSSARRAVGLVGVDVGVEVAVESQKQNQDQHQHLRKSESSGSAPSKAGAKTSEENRSSPSAASTEYAGSILRLLGLPSNPMIMQDLAATIQIRSEVEGCSVEVLANKLAGRIAVLLRESPPVEWGQWVFDARYDYVPQGDKRLNQRGQMARPTCGGKLCSEGWEPVLIDGDRRLRRCPDCVRAWKDAGLE